VSVSEGDGNHTEYRDVCLRYMLREIMLYTLMCVCVSYRLWENILCALMCL